MNDDERRSQAWTNALHGEGTRVVFQRRAESLRRKTMLRDFAGLAVPICLAYLLGAEVFPVLKPYRDLGIAALGLAAVLQTLMVAWSLLARWDEELAYNIRAARESYLLKEGWKRIGQGDVANSTIEYDVLSRHQSIADSHDVEKSVTDSEKQRGMRAALIEFQRKCVCGETPKTAQPPWFKKKPCITCGGN